MSKLEKKRGFPFIRNKIAFVDKCNNIFEVCERKSELNDEFLA